MSKEIRIVNARWIAAFACCTAVALGGCSGNNALVPAAPTEFRTAQTDGGDGGAPPPDALTEAQTTFDTAFERLQVALAAARRQVTLAEAEVSTADTAAARARAQAAIDAARTALTAAVAGIKALEPPADDDGRLGRAHVLAGEADSALAVGNAALRAAETALAARGAWSSRPVVAVDLERRPATTTSRGRIFGWGDTQEHLYEDGKVLLAERRASSGDWLQAPGFPIMGMTNTGFSRYDDRNHLYQAWGGGFGGVAVQPIISTVKLDGDGLQIRWGGRYSGNGRPRSEVFGGSTYDVTVDFGRPESATLPEDYAGYYWRKPIANHGTYYVRLSNLYDVDRGLEPLAGQTTTCPDGTTNAASCPDDDENLYLSAAAYGFWDFIAADNTPHWDRLFPFHTGYYAFRNRDGMRAADISEENKLTSAKFKGKTIAAQYNADINVSGIYNWRVNLENNIHQRLRGDVELTVTITSAAQTVAGKIMNMEQWDKANGHWEDWPLMLAPGGNSGRLDAITWNPVNIRPDGYFEGGKRSQDGGMTTPHNFDEGAFRGRIYGPQDELEAAAVWILQGWNSNTRPSVLGSFGAKHVPDPDSDDD